MRTLNAQTLLVPAATHFWRGSKRNESWTIFWLLKCQYQAPGLRAWIQYLVPAFNVGRWREFRSSQPSVLVRINPGAAHVSRGLPGMPLSSSMIATVNLRVGSDTGSIFNSIAYTRPDPSDTNHSPWPSPALIVKPSAAYSPPEPNELKATASTAGCGRMGFGATEFVVPGDFDDSTGGVTGTGFGCRQYQ